MIFAKTINLVLSGRKTQTLRLAYAGDKLVTLTRSGRGELTEELRVACADGRVRWRVGGTYAVQPERCRFGRGRIRCTYLFEVQNPLEIGPEFAQREGFDDVADYLRVWHELHGRQPVQRCWAIGFVLVDRGGLTVRPEPQPLPPPALPPAAVAPAPVMELRVNTRDERGRKRPVDPETAVALGQLFELAREKLVGGGA